MRERRNVSNVCKIMLNGIQLLYTRSHMNSPLSKEIDYTVGLHYGIISTGQRSYGFSFYKIGGVQSWRMAPLTRTKKYSGLLPTIDVVLQVLALNSPLTTYLNRS